ncbi:SDR family oxidoreductase [Ectopseudomonas composti]|nr:SDR family oxidoreductase [Pseudomonas composti]
MLNVSSGLAPFSLSGFAVYVAMKDATEVWIRYIIKEPGPPGITANVLAPGAIETDFVHGAVRDNTQLNALVAGNTALDRTSLTISERGEGGRWVNGQRIEASGCMFL